MASRVNIKPTYARNMRILGHRDQGGGRAEGAQIMVRNGHAYSGHIFSKGFSVVDARDLRTPKPVNLLPRPPRRGACTRRTAKTSCSSSMRRTCFRSPDPRPNRPVVSHSAAAFADHKGICYPTDFSAGLYTNAI